MPIVSCFAVVDEIVVACCTTVCGEVVLIQLPFR